VRSGLPQPVAALAQIETRSVRRIAANLPSRWWQRPRDAVCAPL